MKTSNPQTERMLVAGFIYNPVQVIDAVVAMNLDYKQLIANADINQVFISAWSVYQSSGELTQANLARFSHSKELETIFSIIDSGQAPLFIDEVLQEAVYWYGVRLTIASQRELAEFLRRDSYDPSGLQDVISQSQAATQAVGQTLMFKQEKPDEFYNDNSLAPFDTKIDWLTTMLHGGWCQGSLEIFASHTGGGKTTFQANITALQILNERPALVVQLERPENIYKKHVLCAMLAAIGKPIPYDRILSKSWTEEELETIKWCGDLINKYLRISTSSFTVPQIRMWANLEKSKLGNHQHTLLQIDHLNMMIESTSKTARMAAGLDMENVVYALHNMSDPDPKKGIGVPILLTAQLEDEASRLAIAKGRLDQEKYKIRACRAIDHAVDTSWAMCRAKVPSTINFQRFKDRNGDGADNTEKPKLYNHSFRWFTFINNVGVKP